MPWSFKMKMILMKEGVWTSVEGEAPAIPTEDQIRDGQKAKQLIVLACEDNQIVHVKQCNDGRAVWNALRDHHRHASAGSLIRTMKALFKSHLKPGV
jgi:hypothetical protein